MDAANLLCNNLPQQGRATDPPDKQPTNTTEHKMTNNTAARAEDLTLEYNLTIAEAFEALALGNAEEHDRLMDVAKDLEEMLDVADEEGNAAECEELTPALEEELDDRLEELTEELSIKNKAATEAYKAGNREEYRAIKAGCLSLRSECDKLMERLGI